MDEKPFLEFSILEINDFIAKHLKVFTKGDFETEAIISTASDLKYLTGIEKLLRAEMQSPTDDFIRLLASRVYGGRLTGAVVEQFKPIVKRAFSSFVNDNVQERLQSALSPQEEQTETAPSIDTQSDDKEHPKIETTEEEKQAFYIVKSLVGEVVPTERVFMRDTQSYCGVLLDDNNRKPICRLFLDSKQRHIGLLDADKNVTKRPIHSLDEIYDLKEELKQTVQRYLLSEKTQEGD